MAIAHGHFEGEIRHCGLSPIQFTEHVPHNLNYSIWTMEQGKETLSVMEEKKPTLEGAVEVLGSQLISQSGETLLIGEDLTGAEHRKFDEQIRRWIG